MSTLRRKHLYRAKRERDGQWVFGDLSTIDVHHACVIREAGVIVHSVEPKTVGEFTGLQDKDGRDIYEDDVIRRDGDSYAMGYVSYSEGMFEVVYRRGMSSAPDPLRDIHGDGPPIVVDGNLHDNPNLL